MDILRIRWFLYTRSNLQNFQPLKQKRINSVFHSSGLEFQRSKNEDETKNT